MDDRLAKTVYKNDMNSYQAEQLHALGIIRRHASKPKKPETLREAKAKGFDLKAQLSGYLVFREEISRFFARWFEDICTENCYTSGLSACCSKDGIIVFWADMVINALVSGPAELNRLEAAIRNPASDSKCIYLAPGGCTWRIKPIVCEMFICPDAENAVFARHPEAGSAWSDIRERKKAFTWPDRPVLFEVLESIFIEDGCRSSLMHVHNSPGLQRLVRNRA